jgi:hypothetical protein
MGSEQESQEQRNGSHRSNREKAEAGRGQGDRFCSKGQASGPRENSSVHPLRKNSYAISD